MGTLKEDIKERSEWVIKAFKEDNFRLDYSISSLIEIDKFFNIYTINGKAVKGGRLSKNLGGILFSIGAYTGECIIKNIEGSVWITNDEDPQGEINVIIELPNKANVWPVQKVMKRFKNGLEDSIYVYGYQLSEKFTKEEFNQDYWNLMAKSKPWWRFW